MIQPHLLEQLDTSSRHQHARRHKGGGFSTMHGNNLNTGAGTAYSDWSCGWQAAGCNTTATTTVSGPPYVKPQKAKVEIEELDPDLSVGVRLKPLEHKPSKDDKIPAWPQVFYTHVADNHWLDDNRSVFTLSMESLVKADEKIKPSDVWLPFMCQDVDTVTLHESFLPKYGGEKLKKVCQKFIVKISPPDYGKAHVPYVQFYCNAKWAKHTGATFQKGDIITVVMKHHGYPLHWPQPPIITVQPAAEQHIVPLLAKQKLVIVTNKDDYNVEYKGNANSDISFDGEMEADFGKQCHYFHCKKPTKSSEVVICNHRKKKKTDSKRVIIPFTEKEVRCPIIFNPTRDSVLHAQNIDSFVVRFSREAYHPLVILTGTPVRNVFTNETAQYIERRFEIDKRRPFIYFEKHEYSWVIR